MEESLLKTNIEVIAKSEGKRKEKFLDTIKHFCGLDVDSKRSKHNTDAKAYDIVTIAKAEVEAALIKADADMALAIRAKTRDLQIEMGYQKNFEQIASKTPKYLGEKKEEDITDEPVSMEWRYRFFEKAKTISKDDLQEIWAQILAEEITVPNTVSLRSLDILSNLSVHEAMLFQKLCNLIISNIGVVPFTHLNEYEGFGLHYGNILNLAEAGLINEGKVNIRLNYMPVQSGWLANGNALQLGKATYKIVTNEPNPPKEPIYMNGFKLTSSGAEISNAMKITYNEEYFALFRKNFEDQGSFSFMQVISP